MPNLAATLENLVIGDDYDIVRTVTGIPSGTILSTAWLTIKRRESDTDAAAVLQKVITASAVAGVGQITDDGTTDLSGALLFQLTSADTALLSERVTYKYDIQVKTASGKIYTVEKGVVSPIAQITRATS